MIAALKVQSLIDENEILRERIKQLEACIISDEPVPAEFNLTKTEKNILRVLIRCNLANRDKIFAALYAERYDDPPDDKLADVFICKIRRKLKPFGIEIKTTWGEGWSLDPLGRDIIKSRIATSGVAQ